MNLYFNELSIKQTDHPETAKQWMNNLMMVYKSVSEKGFKDLRTTENFASELLAPNYTISHWLVDKSVDSVSQSLFRSIALKYPFIENNLDKKNDGGSKLYEFKYNGRIAKGLGAACLFNSLAISLDNNPEWNRFSIMINVNAVSDEETDMTETDEEVKHCSKLEHLDQLKDWIGNLKKLSIPNGKLLWLKRKELFPHLIFCESVQDQVSSLNSSHPEFKQIIKRLFELEDYCSQWENGSFYTDTMPSRITLESDSRINEFKDQLTILCPDGKNRLFSFHSRFTPGAGRIYFAPDNDKKICYVGYIGLKI